METTRTPRKLKHFATRLAKRNARWYRLNRPGLYNRLWSDHWFGRLDDEVAPFNASTDTTDGQTESPVVTDTVTLDAPHGITVLVLNQANFAPRTNGSCCAKFYIYRIEEMIDSKSTDRRQALQGPQ